MRLTRNITAGAAALLMTILSASCARQESAQRSTADREMPIVEAILRGLGGAGPESARGGESRAGDAIVVRSGEGPPVFPADGPDPA